MDSKHRYTLGQLVLYFFKLGYSGFGGPVALVGYMHRDLVEQRGWISEEEYKDGLALAQLAPGPLAAQLCIYLGYVHYGTIGATLAGIAFIIPSFLMVLCIGAAYKAYDGLPWMQGIFYGVGAAVVGIIGVSSFRLTQKSIGSFNITSFKKQWLLWSLCLLGFVLTSVTEHEEILLFVFAGLLYMAIKAPPRWLRPGSNVPVFYFLQTVIPVAENHVLVRLAVFFTKAGAFVFGSGLAIVPFLHGSVVNEFGWLTEHQFVDAVAVAMITPGPVVITVGFIGYLVAGVPGAIVASVATFLPCYLLTILPAPYFKRYGRHPSIKAFVDGITATVVGALMGAVMVIALRTLSDVLSVALAILTAALLLRFRKVKEPWIILAAAVLGLALYSYRGFLTFR